MKVTRKQLRRIIKEAIDVINDETGELIEFGDMEDAAAPEAALDNILKRLNIQHKFYSTVIIFLLMKFHAAINESTNSNPI